MTLFEKKQRPLGVGDLVTHYDDGTDGHPEKWVTGVVTEIGEETFVVQWDDFKEKDWDTEYEWAKVEIIGDQIKETARNQHKTKC